MLSNIHFQMATAPPTSGNEQLPEKQKHMTDQPGVHMPMNLPPNNQIITPNAGYPQPQNVPYPPQNVIYTHQNATYPQQNATYPQQNVPVTIYAQPQIQLNYNSTAAKMFGRLQISLGILAIIIQSVSIYLGIMASFVGTGIWCRIFVSKRMLNFYWQHLIAMKKHFSPWKLQFT